MSNPRQGTRNKGVCERGVKGDEVVDGWGCCECCLLILLLSMLVVLMLELMLELLCLLWGLLVELCDCVECEGRFVEWC
jgi:hypothetical protein